MSTATLTSKGQMTLPKDVREALSLKPGDQVEFVRIGNRFELRPRNLRAADFAGALHRPGMKPMSIEQMDAGITEAVRERDARSRDRS